MPKIRQDLGAMHIVTAFFNLIKSGIFISRCDMFVSIYVIELNFNLDSRVGLRIRCCERQNILVLLPDQAHLFPDSNELFYSIN